METTVVFCGQDLRLTIPKSPLVLVSRQNDCYLDLCHRCYCFRCLRTLVAVAIVMEDIVRPMPKQHICCTPPTNKIRPSQGIGCPGRWPGLRARRMSTWPSGVQASCGRGLVGRVLE